MRRAVAVCCSVFAFAGCASYTDETKDIRSAVASGRFDEALSKIDASGLATSEKDSALYHMERGSILYLEEKYPLAAKDWAAASHRLDELYTTSISRQAKSLAINESYADYEGEVHERLLLPIFSSIAYFANGEPAKAIVEARRTLEVIDTIKAEKDNRSSFTDDPCAHYLAGLMFEAREEWDSAIVEYRAGLAATQKHFPWESEVSETMFVQAIGRLAEYRDKTDLVSSLRKSYPSVRWTKQRDLLQNGEVIVVYEAGRSPVKRAEDVFFPIQDQVVRLSFPVYRDVTFGSRHARVLLQGADIGPTDVIKDIGAVAKQSLQDRRGRDLMRMAVRVLAKGQAARAAGRVLGPLGQIATNVFGAVTETADTRSWTSLPDSLQIARVRIPANKETTVTLQPDFGRPEQWTVTLHAGEKRLVRARTF